MITMRLCTILRGGYISLLSFLHFFPIHMNVEVLITNGKKRRKCLKQFNALMRIAEREGLSCSSRHEIIKWLNEEPVKEGDFKGLVEHMMRLMRLFPMTHEKFLKIYSHEMLEEEYKSSVRSN